jgi:DNA-binding transcriptional LysR family regulator
LSLIAVTASLDHLLSFASAARHESFARAARELGVSPSAVAKNVARLESRLGLRLFHRTTRQVTLTQDGRELFDRCARILEEVEALESTAAGARGTPSGTLRIDVPIAYGKKVLLPILGGLVARYPQLGLDVRFSDRFADLVKEGLDAVIRVGPLVDSGLVARTFDEQALWVCGSPAYLARRGTPRTPADLRDHDCGVFRMPTSGRDWAWRFTVGKRGQTFVPETRIRFDDGEALAGAACAGLCLVQLPHYMVDEQVRGGALVEVLARFRPPPMPISAVYAGHRHVPPRVRVLLDALTQGARGARPRRRR